MNVSTERWQQRLRGFVADRTIKASGGRRSVVPPLVRRVRTLRARYYFGRQGDRRPRDLRLEGLLEKWWYYTVELEPGAVAKGIFPEGLPMLPRMILRHCSLEGAECLDLGSMEGLMPTLMRRGGAKRVLATDFSDHCLEKMEAVKHYYDVDFQYKSIGLMYDVHQKVPEGGFDLINCSGLLYHVFSPMTVVAGIRPLLKRNGLMIVSTNITLDDGYTMDFNNAGRLQAESNTFWYLSPRFFDYMLRYFRLMPVEVLYLPHENIRSGVQYVFDKPSGYLSVLCRATDDEGDVGDEWAEQSVRDSWEYRGLSDWKRAAAQPVSTIGYRDGKDRPTLDLWDAVRVTTPVPGVVEDGDSQILRLTATE